MNKKVTLIFFCLVAIMNLSGQILESAQLLKYSKPLLMPLLILYVYFKSDGYVTIKTLILVAALVLSWGGDLALMYGDEFFLLGVGMFFLAQMSYIFLFYKSTFQKITFVPIRILPLIIYGGFLFYILLPKTGDLMIPVIVYGVSLITMAIVARSRQGVTNNDSFNLVAIGAILFLISDSLLAINKFSSPIQLAGFWTMSTYITAQFLIVSGIIKHTD